MIEEINQKTINALFFFVLFVLTLFFLVGATAKISGIIALYSN
jgi:hypothetical protein